MDAPAPGALLPVTVKLSNMAHTAIEDAEIELRQVSGNESQVVAAQEGVALKGGQKRLQVFLLLTNLYYPFLTNW